MRMFKRTLALLAAAFLAAAEPGCYLSSVAALADGSFMGSGVSEAPAFYAEYDAAEDAWEDVSPENYGGLADAGSPSASESGDGAYDGSPLEDSGDGAYDSSSGEETGGGAESTWTDGQDGNAADTDSSHEEASGNSGSESAESWNGSPGNAEGYDDRQAADLPSDFTDIFSMPEMPGDVLSDISEITDLSLIPADRTEAVDIRGVIGDGVDPDVDAGVDAVSEILSMTRGDTAILQMAAQNSGITEETRSDAMEAMSLGAPMDENIEESLGNAEDQDRQNGRPIEHEPDGSGSDPMAYVSSFVLTGVRDGSGDFDEITDLRGNDSSPSNGIIRTNDDVTYLFSYSTALGDHYLYSTIDDVRLYLEYTLPVGSDEAVFNVGAMPWLKGDGEGGAPQIFNRDGIQILRGYRQLPERADDNGDRYAVPGAGTVNCVISVKKMRSGDTIEPSFRAWIDEGSAGNESPERAVPADLTKRDPEVIVSVGPFVYLYLEKEQQIAEIHSGDYTGVELKSLKDGSPTELDGSGRLFYYVVKCGKKNGSIRGVDSIDPAKRLRLSLDAAYGVNIDVPTDLALYDIRTMSMKGPDGELCGAFYEDQFYGYYNDGDRTSYGETDASTVEIKDSRISFDITGYENNEPGKIVSHGTIAFIQREDESDAPKKATYYASLKAVEIKATPLYSADGSEETFPVSSERRIENQVEPSGNWDSHLVLSQEWAWRDILMSGSMATDASLGYGLGFNAYISTSFRPKDASEYEKSRDYVLLWDNRKVELRLGASSPDPSSIEKEAVYRYVTKSDGSFVNGIDEMLEADFSGSGFYDKFRIWPDYDSAVSFLENAHPGDENAQRYICGVVAEVHMIPVQKAGSQYYQRLGMRMRISDDPSNIRTEAAFVQSVRTYRELIGTTASGENGIGTIVPPKDPSSIRSWNAGPAQYEPSGWDEDGVLMAETLTPLNTLHKGNTLYILPYQLKVTEKFEDGTESRTFDLSASGDADLIITPAFSSSAHVKNAEAVLDIPAVKDGKGQSISKGMKLYAISADGPETELAAGNTYDMSSFIDGAPGSFTVNESELADIYDGGTFRILQEGKALGVPADGAASGSKVKLIPRDDPGAEWSFERTGSGLYRLKHVSSGLALTGSGDEMRLARRNTGEPAQTQIWRIKDNGDGTLSFISAADGVAIAGSGSGGNGSGSGSGGSGTGSGSGGSGSGSGGTKWTMDTVTPSGGDPGMRLAFNGLDSVHGFPGIRAVFQMDKALITGDTHASHSSTVSGDGITEIPTRENGHVASVNLAFTEIYAGVIRETVDLAEVENGQELTYTIFYTNLYDHDHDFLIEDLIPRRDDLSLSDVPETGDDPEIKADIATLLSESGKITLVRGSAEVKADSGSSLNCDEKDDGIEVRGKLRSGESVQITYKVLVEGADPGDLIRNSCRVTDEFGTVHSNRVETTVLPDPDLGVHITLMTGGSGVMPLMRGGMMLAGMACAALLSKKRQKKKRV